MVRPEKRRGGRVTPRGTPPAEGGPQGRVSRNPVRVDTGSPGWLPAAIFGLFGLGIAVILANYLGFLPGSPTDWYLVAGLAMILGGLITATRLR